MKTEEQIAVAVVSDTHTNSTTALVKPGFALEGGGTLSPSRMQRELWRKWGAYWEAWGEEHKDKGRVLVLNGDVLEGGDKHPNNAVHSKSKADVIRMAYETLEPALDVVESVYVIRGTEAHVGGLGELEELLAQDITHAVHASKHAASHWHLCKEFGGVRFDIAHHARMGGLPHTERNAANKIASNLLASYQEAGAKLPNVILRSHVHRVSDTGLNFLWSHNLRALTTPAWETKTAFIRRISNGTEVKPPHIGIYTFICGGGKFDLAPFKVELHTVRHRWTKH